MKNYLKSTHNHTVKHTQKYVQFLNCIDIMEAKTVAEYQVVACFSCIGAQ